MPQVPIGLYPFSLSSGTAYHPPDPTSSFESPEIYTGVTEELSFFNALEAKQTQINAQCNCSISSESNHRQTVISVNLQRYTHIYICPDVNLIVLTVVILFVSLKPP